MPWKKTSAIADVRRLCVIGGAALAAAAVPATAAIDPAHTLTVGLGENSVLAIGYAPALQSPVAVEVVRDGMVIGQALATISAIGEVSVNSEIGDACWVGGTPDILAGDRIVLKPKASPVEEGSRLPHLAIGAPVTVLSAPGVLQHFRFDGLLASATGAPLPLTDLSHRLQSRSGPFSGAEQSLSAPGDGVFAAGVAVGSWALTYGTAELSLADEAAVQGARSELLHTNANEVTLQELAPAPGCTGTISNGVLTASTGLITQANQAQPLTVSGIAEPTAVQATVTIDDSSRPDTAPISVVVPLGAANIYAGKTFSAQLAGLSALADGPLTIDVQVLLQASAFPVDGTPKTIQKIAAAPPTPVASPAPGTFGAPTTVSISAAAGVAGATTVRYTTDGTAPGPTSSVAPAAGIQLAASARLRAVAFDVHGNRSAELEGLYRIVLPQQNVTLGADRAAINAANVGTALTITGLAQSDASAVSLRFTGVGGFTSAPLDATLGDTPTGRTWRVVAPATFLAGLPQGPLTVIPTYTISGAALSAGTAPLTGGTFTIVKDTRVPTAPATISPAPGPFAPFSPPVVTISGCPAGAAVRFTTTGRAPTIDSVATVPVRLPVGKTTTITAACVDAAGNVSRLVSLRYRPDASLLGLRAQAAILSPGTAVVALGRARINGVALRVRLPRATTRATLVLRRPSGAAILTRTVRAKTPTRNFRFAIPASMVRTALTTGTLRASVTGSAIVYRITIVR